MIDMDVRGSRCAKLHGDDADLPSSPNEMDYSSKHKQYCGRTFMRKAVPLRTKEYFVIICILLQFLLTFAQGQGHGDEVGIAPSGERVYFEVREGVSVGYTVGTIQVEAASSYKFSDQQVLFMLNYNSDNHEIEIKTSAEIDRESLADDVFNLVIQSVGTSIKLIEVTITVLDVNDNSPIFGQSSIRISYSESDSPGTQIILDTATDADIAPNDVTTDYRIISGNDNQNFRLVLQTQTSKPLLYLENTKKLDREDSAHNGFYQLNISVADGGSPPKYAYLKVDITINDINDNNPTFDQSDYETSVNETVPVGTSIVQVRATDRDIGNNGEISYRIINQDYEQFLIDPKTGVVTTLKQLTHCQQSCDNSDASCKPKSCVITVEASDAGSPQPLTGRAYITVILLDENDHDPAISFRWLGDTPYATVDETASQDQTVSIVSVTDNDDGDNGKTSLQITRGNELGHFKITSFANGNYVVRVSGTIDRERVGKYNLTMVARDSGSPPRSSTAFLIIMVNDINDHTPQFELPMYHAELSELVPIGSFVAAITATDNDTGINSEITYSFVSGNVQNWFTIDSRTGLVTTVKALNREELSTIILNIQAQDGGPVPHKNLVNLTINILDENDEAPDFFVREISETFEEGTPRGTVVTTVTAIDRDQGINGSVRYSFTPDVAINYPGSFQLSSTGVITTAKDLDREEYATYIVYIIGKDQGTPSLSSTCTLSITVTDLNDNTPVFYPSKYYATVEENKPANNQVLQVSASDPDAGDNGRVLYSISGTNHNFEVDSDSGWVTTKTQLRNAGTSYQVTVNAQDSSGRAGQQSAVVVVNVIDEFYNPPAFPIDGYIFTVLEESDSGRQVGQVLATGAPSSLTYSIADGDENGFFAINPSNGFITTAKTLNREDYSKFNITVVAYTTNTYAETNVRINIGDINDNTPLFPDTTPEVYVRENLPVGSDVFLAQAVDMDEGANARIQYSFTQDSNNLFRIDINTGMIYLARPLSLIDDVLFSLTVTASDSGIPQRSSTADITMHVEDINDHTPVFEYDSYDYSIRESVQLNNRFFQVKAIDEDYGKNGQVLYSIVKGNYDNKFGIFPDGVLYVAHELDRESRSLFVLTIKAQDNGDEPRSQLGNVTVHVIDANDNAPQFSNSTYSMELMEGAEMGTYVGTVYASDRDVGQNAEIWYSFEGEVNGFMIHAKSGIITTADVFDREKLIDSTTVDYITFTVLASDNGSPQLSSRSTISVSVLDANDNAPSFLRSSYEVSVFEDSAINAIVERVEATDKDTSDNGMLTYSIVAGNEGGKFSMDSLRGEIQVAAGLDREMKDEYVLLIMASDSGMPPLNTTVEVRVTILDKNDNNPQFVESNVTFAILETQEQGYVVTQIAAFDRDTGNNALITYNIAHGNTESVFKIDPNNGKLSLAKTLDFEKHQKYVLNVSATDYGSPSRSGYMTINIDITDYNDNAPFFTQDSIYTQIDENVNTGRPVITVTATDRDFGVNGEMRYSILKQEPRGSHFRIDAETGTVYTNGAIDREFAPEFQLTIVATDQAIPINTRKTSQKIVTIQIRDINDNDPVFESMNAATVLQQAQVNTLITTIKAVDADSGRNGEVDYQIFSGDATLFRIEPNTGRLYLQRTISPQITSYDLTIKAQDNPERTADQRDEYFTMTILARALTENGPAFTQNSYTGQVYENESISTSVLSLAASYPGNVASNIEYYITRITSDGQDMPQLFKVNPTSGAISTAQILDREAGYSQFVLEVFAVDKGSSQPKTRSTQVTIDLLDKNDSPPQFKQSEYYIDVSEDIVPGNVVQVLVADDADTQSVVQYRIESGGEGKFSLDPGTGELSVASPIDREIKSSYLLTVEAGDGQQTTKVPVYITITDVNDEAPQFSLPTYSFQIPEQTRTGLTVGRIDASDADSEDNAQVTYSLVSHWGRDKFSVHPQSGVFTLIGTLDYEQLHQYVITVKAQDSGQPPMSSTVTVYMNVIDQNDNAPLFDPSTYSDQVLENATVGTSILMVSATDIDSGSNGAVTYSLVGGDSRQQFSIDPKTGVIRVSKPLDRESQAYYNLAVRALDMAANPLDRLSSTAMVSVILQDANDNAPQFSSPDTVIVMEDSPIGSPVFTVVTKDIDDGDNRKVEYRILSGAQGKFSLGQVDGVLRLNSEVDREGVGEYTLRIQAKDKGSPPKSSTMDLTVVVGDANDHDPVFESVSYVSEVKENIKIGSSLLTVFATDMDSGLNGDLRYLIASGDENEDFYLDSHTGVLSVQKRLDYEHKKRYDLRILVKDLGNPSRSDVTTANVTVTDVNDTPPKFIHSPYTAYVQENMAATALPVHVLDLDAYDADTGVNALLAYSIIDGDKTIFSIDSSSGEIKANTVLDREQQDQYELVIQAMDKGFPKLMGTGTVTILVGDANDNPPYFHHASYKGRVRENLQPPAQVATVHASDDDYGSNAMIRYSLKTDAEGKFTIDSTTGVISTRTQLDREAQGSYELVAVATDEGSIPYSTEVSVLVNVQDTNDNAPSFPQRSLTAFIKDPTTIGNYVVGLTAVDSDEGDNGKVEYSILGQDNTKFNIDHHSGVVTAKQALSSGQGTLRFNLRATDKGDPALYDEIPVTINFLPSGASGFPSFTTPQSNYALTEGTGVGHVIQTLSATGPSSISYHIAGGNIDNTFEVTPTGEVKLAKPLDYERITYYHIWVEARNDNSNPILKDFASLSISVTDENDCEPSFNQLYYNASVTEEEMPPVSVITVTASDKDSLDNGRVLYHFAQDGNVGNAFRIDASTGEIRTQAKLNRESIDSYNLVVTATDQGTPKNIATATVDIQVLDKNDKPPVFTQHFNIRIPENARIGAFVLKITSTDEDIGINAMQTYTLTSNPNNKFAIDEHTGVLTVAAELDRETKDEYILQVAANDGAYNAETSLAIIILDANDNQPMFDEESYYFNVAELEVAGTSIGRVTASDKDAAGQNSEIYFRFKTPTSDLSVDPDTGEIRTMKVFEYKYAGNIPSPENIIHLTLLAIDRGEPSLSSEVSVTVSVQAANKNSPQFEKRVYDVAVAENTQVSSIIITLTATDADEVGDNARISYSVASSNGTGIFVLDSTTGQITIVQSLEGYRNRIYSMEIQAQDYGTPRKSSSATVNIRIAETNEHAPQFNGNAFDVTIPENREINTTVARVSASDSDPGENGIVRFFITLGDPLGQFSIDASGNLGIAKALDYETQKIHYLNITARDRGLSPRQTTRLFTVKLTDVNDSPPLFQQDEYLASVQENVRQGTSFFTVQAYDADTLSNSITEYFITGDSESVEKIHIDERLGVLTTKGQIDKEERDFYNVIVKAINPGSPLSSTTTIRVDVTGVNEYIPQFTEDEYSFIVSESAQPGNSIGQVTANDQDAGAEGQVLYYLIGDSNMQGFAINHKTGDIEISDPIDRESTSEIMLHILAKNNGPIFGNDTDECSARIIVRDANDPPHFTQSSYDDDVSEGADIGTTVLKVSAIDNDLEQDFKQFTYTIEAGNVGNVFTIIPETGWIRTNGRLDRETIPIYNLTVGAIDVGTPPQTGTASVTIFIRDINDNGPYFLPTIPEGTVLENRQGQLVMRLNTYARDRDLDPNRGPYSYRLLDQQDTFVVNQTSGVVLTRVNLDRERVSQYYLSLRVTDNGSPTKTSTLTVKVSVSDENDNPSEPRPMKVIAYAYQGTFPGGKIADTRPRDPDVVGNYRCTLLEGQNSAAFSYPQGCDLYAQGTNGMSIRKINISSTDGIHNEVAYSVEVEFRTFEEDAVDNTLVIALRNITGSEFLRQKYSNWNTVLRSVFGSTRIAVVYNIVISGSDIHIFLAVKESNTYLTRTQISQKITENKNRIQTEADVNIASVNYNPCTSSPCLNNGECSYKIQVGTNIVNVDSTQLVMAMPDSSQAIDCTCQDGFRGERCEEPVNKCQQNPCKNQGTCESENNGSYLCKCPPQWSGPTCEEDVNECEITRPCKNGGSCLNKPGSYDCECPEGYQGFNCDEPLDPCTSGPCLNEGKCVNDPNTQGAYTCQCKFGDRGDKCEIRSKGFGELSYMEYSRSLDPDQNTIEIEFATTKQNALLLYQVRISGEFVALEIVNKKMRFSFLLDEDDEVTRVEVPRVVTDGGWYRIEAKRDGKRGYLRVEDCPYGQEICNTCQDTDQTCYDTSERGRFSTFDTESDSILHIGGVKELDTLQPGHVLSHDFVGCMREISVDKVSLFQVTPTGKSEVSDKCTRGLDALCDSGTCSGHGNCVDEWAYARCDCDYGFTGETCDNEGRGFSFGSNSIVKYTVKESYIRQQMLEQSAASRKRRAVHTSSLSVSFRTQENTAILFYSATKEDFTVFYLSSGKVIYHSETKGVMGTIETADVYNNGEWHNMTATLVDTSVTLTLDGTEYQRTLAGPVHDPVDIHLTSMSLGDADMELTVNGESRPLPGFSGCMGDFLVDGAPIPLSGNNERFSIEAEGEMSATCEAYLASVDKSTQDKTIQTNVVIGVVCALFGLILIGLIIGFIVLRKRRQNMKNAGKSNGTIKNNGILDKNDSSHQDSGYTEGGGDFSEEAIIHQHIANELANQMYQEREIGDVRPDIIGAETATVNVHSLSMDPSGVDNAAFMNDMEPPEHYDIDNASSIAPSDLVDVVGYYKRFRNRAMGNQKYKGPTHHRHAHYRHTPSPSSMLAPRPIESPSTVSRPDSISSHSRSSPNILQSTPMIRQSPMPGALGHKSPLTINNVNNVSNALNSRHSPANVLGPNHRQSPGPNIAAKRQSPMPSSMRSTPLSGLSGLYNSNLSNSSYSDNHHTNHNRPPLPNGHAHIPRPNSKLKQPINQIGHHNTPTKGLTIEEVERLNARHTPSISTLDVVSSSSDDPHRNNLNRTDFTHSDLLDPNAMLPPESSSEDDTNDSFTCSEFEYDHDKIQNNAHPAARLFPRLARVDENEDTDTTISRTMHNDGTLSDSNRESISTFFTTSDDEASNRQGRPKLPNGALNWEYLNNWGPNFEKLVGVFNDIAELPDSDTPHIEPPAPPFMDPTRPLDPTRPPSRTSPMPKPPKSQPPPPPIPHYPPHIPPPRPPKSTISPVVAHVSPMPSGLQSTPIGGTKTPSPVPKPPRPNSSLSHPIREITQSPIPKQNNLSQSPIPKQHNLSHSPIPKTIRQSPISNSPISHQSPITASSPIPLVVTNNNNRGSPGVETISDSYKEEYV